MPSESELVNSIWGICRGDPWSLLPLARALRAYIGELCAIQFGNINGLLNCIRRCGGSAAGLNGSMRHSAVCVLWRSIFSSGDGDPCRTDQGGFLRRLKKLSALHDAGDLFPVQDEEVSGEYQERRQRAIRGCP